MLILPNIDFTKLYSTKLSNSRHSFKKAKILISNMTQSCDGSLGICVSSFGNIHHQKIALHFNIITIVQSLNILSSTHKMTDFEERIISLWSDSGVAKISPIKSCQREKDRNTTAGEKNSSWQYLPFRCSQSKNKTFNLQCCTCFSHNSLFNSQKLSLLPNQV